MIENSENQLQISPEALEVANAYLSSLSIENTSRTLSLPRETVVYWLNKKEVKSYVDAIFLEQGYMNRYTLQETLSNIIDKKLEECAESEVYSKKDIADLLKLAHDMRMSEIKAMQEVHKIDKQVNIQQNNYGENYAGLLKKLVGE